MTATVPDAWQEVFLFSIQKKGGSEVQFAGITEDITGLDFGDKDFESAALANGGRVAKWSPQADESVTLKMWPTDADLDGNGVVQLFHPQDTEDTSDPILVQNTRNRNKYQLVFLWTQNIGTYSSAGVAGTTGDAAYRITIKNAYMTSYKPSFDDKNFSAEVTFKFPPFAKDGTSNKKEESNASSGSALPAVTAYV